MGCEPVRPPPRRVVVRVDPTYTRPDGQDAPSELRRVVPDKVLGTLQGRAGHGCRKARREVREVVDDLRAAHTVVVPAGADPVAFAKSLGTWEGAKEVYLEPEPALPPTKEGKDHEHEGRGEGRKGRDLPGWVEAIGGLLEQADGKGVSFVDVEWGWAEHEALPRIETVFGVRRGWYWHGNAVLGVIVGHSERVQGIAPRARPAFASPWTDGGTYEVADAIAACIGRLDPGDVLLLELQTRCGDASGLPIEVDPVVSDLISLAVHSGIIVVEAAGNGGWHLDEVCVSGRGPGQIGSSGALLVGSVDPDTKRRDPSSGWGTAVDCCAWGDDVATAWSNHLGTATNAYNPSFSGTSAAAAIVAGVAIAVQSVAKRRGRVVLPDEMTELLRKGTPVDGVGVFPNLARIVADLP